MLTLQYVPYSEIENLDSEKRIKKLLRLVKEDKIVLMQGRLKPEEETMLIQVTMGQINKVFKGIEICTIYEEKGAEWLNKFKKSMVDLLIGTREGITIIGPASVIKEIKRDPNKIQLFTENKRRKKKR